MDPNKAAWNQQFKRLQSALARPQDHPEAVDLFLKLHAALHASEMSGEGVYSFEDPIWQGLTDQAARLVPAGQEHSIAWIFWHVTRIEDITMNLLVAGKPQVLNSGSWLEKLGVSDCDTGNEWSIEKIAAFGASIHLSALRCYRMAVGRQTRENLRALPLTALKERIEPERLRQIDAEGAVGENGSWLVDFWGHHTRAGLLLMPATRHIFVHLNEAQRLRKK